MFFIFNSIKHFHISPYGDNLAKALAFIKIKLYMRKYNAIAHESWWISLKACVRVGFLPSKSFRGRQKWDYPEAWIWAGISFIVLHCGIPNYKHSGFVVFTGACILNGFHLLPWDICPSSFGIIYMLGNSVLPLLTSGEIHFHSFWHVVFTVNNQSSFAERYLVLIYWINICIFCIICSMVSQ